MKTKFTLGTLVVIILEVAIVAVAILGIVFDFAPELLMGALVAQALLVFVVDGRHLRQRDREIDRLRSEINDNKELFAKCDQLAEETSKYQFLLKKIEFELSNVPAGTRSAAIKNIRKHISDFYERN